MFLTMSQNKVLFVGVIMIIYESPVTVIDCGTSQADATVGVGKKLL
jgi:hypothetical protein